MPPQVVVLQLGGGGLLKAKDIHAPWVKPFKHFAHQAVFTAGIHTLEYNQHTIAVIGIHFVLHGTKVLSRFF